MARGWAQEILITTVLTLGIAQDSLGLLPSTESTEEARVKVGSRF
jgi:hypothetical protein